MITNIIYFLGASLVLFGFSMILYASKNIFKGFWLMFFENRKEWHNERLAICDRCSPHSDTCPVCHCFKVPKAMIKQENCPKNLWP